MISLLIPIYNEEDILRQYNDIFFPTVESLQFKIKESFELIFIDDASTDASWAIISEFVKTRSNTIGLRHERNRGMGGAIKTGIKESHGDLLIFLDSDLTFKPEDIEVLYNEYCRDPADCISGSPYLHPGLMDDVQPWRMFLSRSVNILYRVLLGEQITSISPIFRLYHSSVFQDMVLSSENFEINAEILAKMLFKGMKIREVPVALHKRTLGESKSRLGKSVHNHLVILYKIFIVKYLGREWN